MNKLVFVSGEFEDTKGVIRICISKKNRQRNGKEEKYKQRSIKHTYKTKDRVTRTPLKTGSELRCSGRVSSSCFTSNFSTSTITDHEKSRVHQETTKMYLASKNPMSTRAHKSLIAINESKRKQIDLKFRNLHAVIQQEEFEDTNGAIRICISKKNRQHNGQKEMYNRTSNDLQNMPLSDNEWLKYLYKAKGLHHGDTYYSRKASTIFLETKTR